MIVVVVLSGLVVVVVVVVVITEDDWGDCDWIEWVGVVDAACCICDEVKVIGDGILPSPIVDCDRLVDKEAFSTKVVVWFKCDVDSSKYIDADVSSVNVADVDASMLSEDWHWTLWNTTNTEKNVTIENMFLSLFLYIA